MITLKPSREFNEKVAELHQFVDYVWNGHEWVPEPVDLDLVQHGKPEDHPEEEYVYDTEAGVMYRDGVALWKMEASNVER